MQVGDSPRGLGNVPWGLVPDAANTPKRLLCAHSGMIRYICTISSFQTNKHVPRSDKKPRGPIVFDVDVASVILRLIYANLI